VAKTKRTSALVTPRPKKESSGVGNAAKNTPSKITPQEPRSNSSNRHLVLYLKISLDSEGFEAAHPHATLVEVDSLGDFRDRTNDVGDHAPPEKENAMANHRFTDIEIAAHCDNCQCIREHYSPRNCR
jgi:hypothetical protein